MTSCRHSLPAVAQHGHHLQEREGWGRGGEYASSPCCVACTHTPYSIVHCCMVLLPSSSTGGVVLGVLFLLSGLPHHGYKSSLIPTGCVVVSHSPSSTAVHTQTHKSMSSDTFLG